MIGCTLHNQQRPGNEGGGNGGRRQWRKDPAERS